jgi:hypothetical protein
MSLSFYPHSDDLQTGTFEQRLELLAEAAERYKAIITDISTKVVRDEGAKKVLTPRDQQAAFNWEEIARILREIRELPEMDATDKRRKGMLLKKLAEIYEVLRAAKMPKLEAVRLALISEANQLAPS